MILKHGGKVSAFPCKAKQKTAYMGMHLPYCLSSGTGKPERGNVSKWGMTIKYELKTAPHHVKAYFRYISNPGILTNVFGGKAIIIIFCFQA